jgi:hypothetical protein
MRLIDAIGKAPLMLHRFSAFQCSYFPLKTLVISYVP